MSIREYLIRELCELETETLTLTDTLYKALIASLRESFGLSEPMASKAITKTLRELYG